MAHPRGIHFLLISFLILLFYEIHLGLSFLNPFNLGWLFDHPSDLTVNFTGWDFFQNEPWTFPIGEIRNYFYPLGTNIYMTDIPLVALPLKLLSPILPAQFQYVGLWLLFNHLLQGWFSILLCERLEIKGFRRIMVCLFLVFSPVFLIRFEHATLFAHWLILASLYVYFIDPQKTSLKNIILAQLVLIVISALIMVYLWLMVFGFAAALLLRLWLIDKKIKYYHVFLLLVGQAMLVLLLWLLIGLISFDSLPDYQSSGWGEYSMNLNSFLNPVNTSSIFSSLPHFPLQVFEGYAYLGAGVILLIVFAAASFLINYFSRVRHHHPPLLAGFLPDIHLGPLILFLAGCFLFALSCNITFNHHLLYHYELKGFLLKIANSFRGSGRFSWPIFYFVMVLLFGYLNRIKLSSLLTNSIMAGCFLFQLYDLQVFFLPSKTAYSDYRPPLLPSWEKLIQSFDNIVFYPGFARSYQRPHDYKYFTYYAARYQKKINAGYVARFDYWKAEAANAKVRDAILSKGLDEHTLYITTLAYLNRLAIPIEKNQALYLNLDGYIAVFSRNTKNEKLFNEIPIEERNKRSQVIDWMPIELKEMKELPLTSAIKISLLEMDDTDDHFYLKGRVSTVDRMDHLHDSVQLVFASQNKYWVLPVHRFDGEDIAADTVHSSNRHVNFGATLLKSKLGQGVYRVGLRVSNLRTGFKTLRWTDTLFTIFKSRPPRVIKNLPGETDKLKLSLEIASDNDRETSINGWAFPASGNCVGCEKFIVLSSSKVNYIVAFISGARPDVVNYFNDTSLLLTGVKVKLMKNEILPGTYNVGVLLRDTVHQKEYFSLTNKLIKAGGTDFAVPHIMSEIPTGREKVRAFIDKVEDKGTFVEINGWAFIDSLSTDLSSCTLALRSGDVYYEVVPDRTYRSDLKSYFNLTYSTEWAGLSVKINKNDLPSGRYQVCLVMDNNQNRTRNLLCLDVNVEISKLAVDTSPVARSNTWSLPISIGIVIISFFFLLLLTDAVFVPSRKAISVINQSATFFDLLICFSVCLALYVAFFYFAPWFRELNLNFPLDDFTPQIQPFIAEHDGWEPYLLFILMPVSILLSLLASSMRSVTGSSIQQNQSRPAFALLVVMTLIYLFQIGWHPPMESVSSSVASVVLLFTGLMSLLGLLHFLNRHNYKLSFGIAALLILPLCFIALQPISSIDYSFIWAPGYRLISGFSVNEIYLQYDLLLSLLGAAWMKLHIDLRYFQFLGQLSFYLLFIFLLIFSKAFFHNKSLWIPFFLFLVVTRGYAIIHDPAYLFQVTPLRLDLWLMLVILVYHKGPWHWSVGLTLGLMLLVHRNFGSIYLVCYVELLALLLINDFIGATRRTFSQFLSLARKHLQMFYKNALIILGFVVLSAWLYNGLTPESAVLYRKIGIGMMPISEQSFYWYAPVFICMISVLLFRYRAVLATPYLTTASFIILLAIGNSLYFFGRSHEHNILNISAILSLTLFLFFDLLFFIYSRKLKPNALQKYLIHGLPILVLLMATYFYSDRIIGRVTDQYARVRHLDFIYALDKRVSADKLALVRELTSNSSKVYFFDFESDFQFYYYGHYQPLGYFSPCFSWVFSKDMFGYMQALLDEGYFIVIGPTTLRDYHGIVPLQYTYEEQKEGFMVIKKN